MYHVSKISCPIVLTSRTSNPSMSRSRSWTEITSLLQIHSLHGLIHALNYIHHAPSDCSHCDSSLHSTSHCVDPTAQSQEIQPLILFADGILCIDFGYIVMALLDRFLELVLFSLLVFGGFCSLAVELFGCELWKQKILVWYTKGYSAKSQLCIRKECLCVDR